MGSIPSSTTSSSTPSDSDSDQVLHGEPPRKKFKQLSAYKTCTVSKLASEREIKKKLKTAKCTNWAVNVFQEWREKRNKASPEDLVPCDLLEQKYGQEASSFEPLIRCFSLFLAEARNRDGKPYTPLSLQGLLFGLLRYMRQQNPYAPNFMDKKDERFQELHRVIDSTYAHLEEQGVGAQKKCTTIMTDITPEQENYLWRVGVLGTNSPLKLLRAVYFKLGSVFHINGALKHRYLKPSILRRDVNPDRYTYVVAKRGPRSKEFYSVCYATPSNGERCLVYLLDLYLTKLPHYAFKNDVLYLRPKLMIPRKEEDCLWYEPIPIGIEKLRIMGRDIYTAARVDETVPPMLPSTASDQSSVANKGQTKQHPSENEVFQYPEVVSQVTAEELSLTCSHHEESSKRPPPEQQQEVAMGTSPMTSVHSCCCSDHSPRAELCPLTLGVQTSKKLKRESEIHIYESDHHCVYIYMHRCKNRKGRRGSCPPTFATDNGIH